MKKKLMALGMAAVLAFGAAGCGGGTDAKTDDTALEDFNIVLDWYPNAIHSFLYVAQEKGYFADEGLNLVINFPANTNDGISMPAAGKASRVRRIWQARKSVIAVRLFPRHRLHLC